LFTFLKIKQKLRLFYEHHWEDFHFSRIREWKTLSNWFYFNKNDRICDIACGKGFFTRKISKIDSFVYGIDRDKSEIKKAQQYNKVINNRFLIADAEKLPFKSEIFDNLISISALEHFNNDKKALKEMSRVLKLHHNLFMTVDSLSHQNIRSDYKKIHAKKYNVVNFYNLDVLKKKIVKKFILEESKYILNSKVSTFFEKLHFKLGLSGLSLFFFFISYPFSVISDYFFGNPNEGCSLAVKLRRK